MDLARIILELRIELENIDHAIRSLERVAASHLKKRGRPPKWMAEIESKTFTNTENKTGKAIQVR